MVPARDNPQWNEAQERLPTPVARALLVYLLARPGSRQQATALGDFAAVALGLLHAIALGVRRRMPPTASTADDDLVFHRFRRRWQWGAPRDVRHDWRAVNPHLPEAARLPLHHAEPLPSLAMVRDICGGPRPHHFLEALGLLSTAAGALADDRVPLADSARVTAELDGLLLRLVTRDLAFLAHWRLLVAVPPGSGDRVTAIAFQSRRETWDAHAPAAVTGESQHVQAIPATGRQVFDLHPFCVYGADQVATPGTSGLTATGWPTLHVLTDTGSGAAAYLNAASGRRLPRPDLQTAVTDACDRLHVLPRQEPAHWGLLLVKLRRTRKLNDTCGYAPVDEILAAMDKAAGAWAAANRWLVGSGPTAFPFWRHGDEMAIPFTYVPGACPDLRAVVQEAAARVVSAAVQAAVGQGIGIPTPVNEDDSATPLLVDTVVKIGVAFTLDLGVPGQDPERFAQHVLAEFEALREALRAAARCPGDGHDRHAPVLWVHRQRTTESWQIRRLPLFSRISEGAFAMVERETSESGREWLLRFNRAHARHNLVGGHLEDGDGDDWLACIRRELGEELGLAPSAIDLEATASEPTVAVQYSDREHCMTLYLLRFFRARPSPDAAAALAVAPPQCRWEPVANILDTTRAAERGIATFPACLLADMS